MKHLPFGKYEVTAMPSWSKSAKSDLWSEAFSICRRNTSLAKRLHSRRLLNVPKERFIEKTVDFYRNLPFFSGCGGRIWTNDLRVITSCRSPSCVAYYRLSAPFARTLGDTAHENSSPDCFHFTNPTSCARRSHNPVKKRQTIRFVAMWLRGPDLNQRPSGYELSKRVYNQFSIAVYAP